VVLDEAHLIKSHATLSSRAVVALRGARRWAVTGTPLHNTCDDMLALLKFLRADPWADTVWWTRAVSRPLLECPDDARVLALVSAALIHACMHTYIYTYVCVYVSVSVCLCVCVYTYINIYVNIYVNIYIYIYIYINIYVNIYICVCKSVYLCVCVCVRARARVRVCVCVCIYVCMYRDSMR
jgi:hypothetical protein